MRRSLPRPRQAPQARRLRRRRCLAMPEPGAQATGYATREDAIAASPRIPIDSPALLGSINLKGARIDDVILRDYKETVIPNSPDVVLLSPSGSPHPYFTYTGWLTNEPGVKLPNENTPWQQEGTGPLTATHPVVLRYDNGEGLIFHRTISVDDHYMFTISDQVENKTGQPVTLRPWGQVAQLTEPKTLGYSVLHEGPIGVFGDSGLNEPTFSSSIKNFDPSKGPIPAKDTFTAKGGWLGFTSQYWAAVLVPNQSTPYEAGMFGNEHKQFYADYLQEPVTVAPGSTGTVTNRLFAGAKEVKLLEKYRSDYRHRALQQARGLGLVLLPHRADVLLDGLPLSARREFRPRHHVDDCDREGRLLPAREQVLRVR